MSDGAHRVMNDLVDAGHNIRDVLNAGIVLFKKASREERGLAHMEAYSRPQEDVRQLVKAIETVDLSRLEAPEKETMQRLRDALAEAKTPDVHYETLTLEEQEILNQMRAYRTAESDAQAAEILEAARAAIGRQSRRPVPDREHKAC